MNISQVTEWVPRVLPSFFTLSYPIPRPEHPDSFLTSNYYGKGYLDICFVLAWIGVLAFLREFLRLCVFEPFARSVLYYKDLKEQKSKSSTNGTAVNGVNHANGNGHASLAKVAKPQPPKIKGANASKQIVNKKPKGMSKVEWKRERSTLRFAEQGWQFAYYIVYWPLGFYIHMNLPSAPFNLDRLWIDYPHIPLAGPLKFYYLSQLGFWFHQVLILNAEARRKDHIQMMSHHVITITLVITSYCYNTTRSGVLIMVLMDFCDIFLALSKMCQYLRVSEIIMNSVFGIFAFAWVITRDILFGIVIYSAYKDSPRFIKFKWEPENGHYITYNWYVGFVSLMVALQILLYLWTIVLLRIIWNVLGGTPPEDSRSDEERHVTIFCLNRSTLNSFILCSGDEGETKKEQ